MSTAFLRRAHFLQKGSLVKGGLSRIQEQVRDRGILYGLPPGFRWFRKINVGRGYPKGISSLRSGHLLPPFLKLSARFESDGVTIPQSFAFGKIQLPLHKGAFSGDHIGSPLRSSN